MSCGQAGYPVSRSRVTHVLKGSVQPTLLCWALQAPRTQSPPGPFRLTVTRGIFALLRAAPANSCERKAPSGYSIGLKNIQTDKSLSTPSPTQHVFQ